MKFYGKSQETCEKIIDMFQAGNVPEKLKIIFIKKTGTPSGAWSWSNQFLTAISGTDDARGFKQWQKAGRKVKKGSKAFNILGPCIINAKNTTEPDKTILIGFKSIPVFRLEDTEVFNQDLWDKEKQEETKTLDSFPLLDVAKSWGLDVGLYTGKENKPLGIYKHGSKNGIFLGVENLATWTHELNHAADHRNGTLTKGDKENNEVVAELGGAVLLQLLGEKTESDLGGAWEYIKHYAGGNNDKSVQKCISLINRVCNNVNLILTETV